MQSTAFLKIKIWLKIGIFAHFIRLGLFFAITTEFSSCNSKCMPHKAFEIFTIWRFIESLQISAIEKNSARQEQ